jgi:hypothetical protein
MLRCPQKRVNSTFTSRIFIGHARWADRTALPVHGLESSIPWFTPRLLRPLQDGMNETLDFRTQSGFRMTS